MKVWPNDSGLGLDAFGHRPKGMVPGTGDMRQKAQGSVAYIGTGHGSALDPGRCMIRVQVNNSPGIKSLLAYM